MSALAAAILVMLTVYVDRDIRPVYAVHMRRHPLGAELRAEQLAEDLLVAASRAGVPVHVLAAVEDGESAFGARLVSREGALGRLQLLPRSRWGRAWLRSRACKKPESRACESANVLWGAYALRDGLAACGGSEVHAVGFYRTGRCVAGPRSRLTMRIAHWLRLQLRELGGVS